MSRRVLMLFGLAVTLLISVAGVTVILASTRVTNSATAEPQNVMTGDWTASLGKRQFQTQSEF